SQSAPSCRARSASCEIATASRKLCVAPGYTREVTRTAASLSLLAICRFCSASTSHSAMVSRTGGRPLRSALARLARGSRSSAGAVHVDERRPGGGGTSGHARVIDTYAHTAGAERHL